jgi:hypothetical protein
MTPKAGNGGRFILWILGGVVGLCLCSCGRLFIPGETAETTPAVQATTTVQGIGRGNQTAEPIPVQAIAAQAIALATEIARPTNTPEPTNTLHPIHTNTSIPTNTPRPTATRTPTPTATPDERVLNPENQHLYLFIGNPDTWHRARDYCASRGGHLVTIESASENGFVRELAGVGSWLGATDEIQEGTWVWVTGESWDFSDWDAGEPNNCCPGCGCTPPEQYLSFSSHGATWNDMGQRGDTAPFACEWEPVSP